MTVNFLHISLWKFKGLIKKNQSAMNKTADSDFQSLQVSTWVNPFFSQIKCGFLLNFVRFSWTFHVSSLRIFGQFARFWIGGICASRRFPWFVQENLSNFKRHQHLFCGKILIKFFDEDKYFFFNVFLYLKCLFIFLRMTFLEEAISEEEICQSMGSRIFFYIIFAVLSLQTFCNGLEMYICNSI